jgi:hypothetical protein
LKETIKGKQASTSAPTSNILQSAKKEFVDCCASVAGAKSNEERIERTKNIIFKHRGTLLVGAGTLFVARAMARKR